MWWSGWTSLEADDEREQLQFTKSEKQCSSENEMHRASALRLFTKTWPKKTGELSVQTEIDANEYSDDEKDDLRRPSTATLDHPQVLDAQFMGQIDMSLIRKEFLAITSLCRAPLTNANRAATTVRKSRHRTAVVDRRRPLAPAERIERTKKQRKHESFSSEAEGSWEDESLSSGRDSAAKRSTPFLRPPAIVASKSRLRKPAANVAACVEINNNASNAKAISTKALPEPCTTCGRPDAPERFHSHPSTPLKPLKQLEAKIPVKNTVQKPVAIKYKSKLEPKTPEAPAMLPAKTKSPKGPRTLTCYICGREFGTASLHLHEPKCLEKWGRENQKLPKQLQKKPPTKPDHPLTKEEWNKFAWESAQAQLIPCKNCNRTFLPDRLEVHQRSCREPQRGPVKSSSAAAIDDLSARRDASPAAISGLVPCPHCGKTFGSKSVKIHEPQCLRKLRKDKDAQVAAASTDRTTTTSNEKKPHMFPCYLCGRLFGVASVYIHEPQCLKKWRAENDRLPAEKRRPTPPKPDVKFTPDGKIDFVAAEEANWQSHLDQLVPCHLCGRTFNPDRVEVHERSCKGPAA